jgi:predicted nucleotidyltransferase
VRSAIEALLCEAFARERGVRVAVLFGSVAEGRDGEASDIDLAVLAPGVDLLELAQRLGAQLGREVDVVDLSRATIPLMEELVAHGVSVHESEPGAAALWRSRTLATLETDRPWFARMRDAFLGRWSSTEADRGPR